MSRRHHDEEEGGHERWLVSYADFITLLFAFFAVLYATSQKDVEKSKQFQDSIKKFLIKGAAGAGIGSGGGPPQVLDAQKNNSVIEPPIPTYDKSKPETVQTLDVAETFIDSQLTKDERKKFVLDVTADDWGVRIIIPNTAIFADHSDKFRSEAVPFLSKLGSLIVQTKRKVFVEGHVGPDETGSFGSTWEFSSARALNILRFLQKKEKLPSSVLASASLGDSRPLVGARDPAHNSRMEIVLLNSDFEF